MNVKTIIAMETSIIVSIATVLISGNLIFRGSGNEEWAGGEYPLLLTACQRPHAVGNLLRGKAAELTDCISPTLSYSGNDWNPTA